MKPTSLGYLTRLLWAAALALAAAPTPAEPINRGDAIIKSICGGTQNFELTVGGSDKVVAHVTECWDFGGQCQGAALNFDQCLALRDPADAFVAEVCTPLDGNSFRTFTKTLGPQFLTSTGDYVFSVADANMTGGGRYTIFVQSLETPGRASALTPGQAVLGHIAQCGQADTYRFAVAPGERVIIEMTPAEVGELLPRLELFDASAAWLSKPDSGSIDVVADAGGTLTLLAYSDSLEVGTYRLLLTLDIPPFCPKKGDVDGDCAITPDDALCLFQHYLDQPSCLDN